MEIRNLSFGAITVGALKKRMILKDAEGEQRVVLSSKNSSGGKKEVTFQYADKDRFEKPRFTTTYDKTSVLNYDLVGWEKK
ncbi:MAG: hypothetical protein WCG23_08810 [bacterium]